MNDINLNALGRSVSGIDKSVNSAGSQKSANTKTGPAELDSIQLSNRPDLSKIDEALEDEFAALRSKFEGAAHSPSYPPLEIIDRLAHMLAVNISKP